MSKPVRSVSRQTKRIWIDLDNSPHVPFFVPIIQELKKRGYDLTLTSRDNAQVLELLSYHKIECKHFGRHYGKHTMAKVVGTSVRALQLAPHILQEKPDLALSHGSRSQILLATLLKIPCVAIADYEHAQLRMAGIKPQWLIVPEVIADSIMQIDRNHVLKYPGIKEDVYVPRFRPIPGIREELGLSQNDLVVTIRPPANEAHYHNPVSDELFHAVVEHLSRIDDIRMVLLPRHKSQDVSLQKTWPDLFSSGKVRIPDHVVDGLNLIWFSDLVISGGGTMTGEAAALGVPVYSIFRGKSAAVDRYLTATERLICLESAKDMHKIRLTRRQRPADPEFGERAALAGIVENVIATLNLSCHTHQFETAS